MSALEKRFRRNFVLACVVHAALIGGIVLFEGVINNARSNAPTPVELITPADILGDLPKGEGQGRGNYAPPLPETPSEPVTTSAGPTAPPAAPEEPIAPKVKAPPPESKSPDEVAIPKKPTTKEVKKTTDAPVKKAVTSAKSTTNTVKAVASTKSAIKSGASGTAESATSIRQRFASALASAEGGTPGGNNRAAGGGTGESKYGRLGSPDGSADGIAGGIGKGSPFWSYYMQIHDRMYEAWEQPGQAVGFDKKLVATVLLRIARNGRIEGVRLQHSSGNKLMDDSAVTAANSVPRLDPLPEGLGGDFAEISVNFRLEG
ncbi:MAG: TonB family protein [Verrucomicrobiia bacterium]|jgi:TonB family protein